MVSIFRLQGHHHWSSSMIVLAFQPALHGLCHNVLLVSLHKVNATIRVYVNHENNGRSMVDVSTSVYNFLFSSEAALWWYHEYSCIVWNHLVYCYTLWPHTLHIQIYMKWLPLHMITHDLRTLSMNSRYSSKAFVDHVLHIYHQNKSWLPFIISVIT